MQMRWISQEKRRRKNHEAKTMHALFPEFPKNVKSNWNTFLVFMPPV